MDVVTPRALCPARHLTEPPHGASGQAGYCSALQRNRRLRAEPHPLLSHGREFGQHPREDSD